VNEFQNVFALMTAVLELTWTKHHIRMFQRDTQRRSKQGHTLIGVMGKGQMLKCKCRAGKSGNKCGCIDCICCCLVMTAINCNGADLAMRS